MEVRSNMKSRLVTLIILDGFGTSDIEKGNAIKTPKSPI